MGHCKDHHCRKGRKRKEKPHGAYTIDVGPFPGSICFNKGKTVHGVTGLDINFPNPISPTGNFGSVWTGDVSRKGCKKYQIVMTNVLSTKADVGPATPFVRTKLTVDIEFDFKFKTFSGIFVAVFYALDDIGLKNPIDAPIEFPIVGEKLVA